MQNDIKKALQVLKSGGIILYPTDTAWSIGCDATNPEAVAKIYKLKQREDCKGIAVLVDSANLLNHYLIEVPEIAYDLIELSDKPLTIIFHGAKRLAPNIIAPDGSIGIRVVKHTFCQRLIQSLGCPIVSTSANIEKNPLPAHFEGIDPLISEGVDLIIPRDYEENPHPIASSIIQLGVGGQVKVIRE
jgi:L-threonylcarbamoyladenylate synthase